MLCATRPYYALLLYTIIDPIIPFQALCNAVEHEKFEKAKSILEQHPDLRLDGINSDGFTPLDLVSPKSTPLPN